MPIGEWIDFGTLRVFDTPAGYDYHFPREDRAAKEAVRSLGGARWEPSRRCWRTPKHDPERVETGLRDSLRRSAPPGWIDRVRDLLPQVATTTRYEIVAGLGGVRLDMPRGYRHRRTLARMGALADGPLVYVPAAIAMTDPFARVLEDIVDDDRVLLGRAVDDLAGFAVEGRLREGVEPSGTVAVARGLVESAYTDMDPQPVRWYPMTTRAPDAPDGRHRFSFLTGDAAWNVLREIGCGEFQGVELELGDATGRWRMRTA